MRYLPDGSIRLELPELIRMNCLVRGHLDMTGFKVWYHALPHQEQVALLCHLHLFAQQAGYDTPLYEQAVHSAELALDHPLVKELNTFRGGYSQEFGLEEDWFSLRTADECQLLLPLLVFLFGYAEGRVFATETEESCNHWWHRDLLDERVIQDLLRDPTYHHTAMKNDRSIKSK